MSPEPPYLPISVEEIAAITSLDHWTNRKVRVVGRLTNFDPVTCSGELAGEGEGVAAAIRLCFAAVLGNNSGDRQTAGLVQPGSLIQILGEVDILQDAPIVRSHIVRDRLGLDPRAYHAALVRIQAYLPLNVRRS